LIAKSFDSFTEASPNGHQLPAKAMVRSKKPDGPSVMHYCHDSYGLGHLRRTLAVAQHLRTHTPSISQLIVTGSPVPQNFPFPEGTDYIKLPSVVKVGAGQYESRFMPTPFSGVQSLRSDIVLSAARHFDPDVLIVDHAPAGLEGEIVATLRYFKTRRRETRLILGLRDIIDEPAAVRHAWKQAGIYSLLDNTYDRILVYGDRDVYDVVREYAFSPRAAGKTRYVGYLRRESGARSPEQIRKDLNLRTDRLVLATAGGGEDGYTLFQVMLATLRRRPEPVRFDCLLVAGPLMSKRERDALIGMAGSTVALRILPFAEDMTSYIAAADVVISMGGYNSVCEILSFSRPAIVVPRVRPRQEQLLRAKALSQRRLLRMIHPAELSPGRLLDEVNALLDQGSVAEVARPALDGLAAVATEFDALLLHARVRRPERSQPATALASGAPAPAGARPPHPRGALAAGG
jgi:predicted glycosyltransferase